MTGDDDEENHGKGRDDLDWIDTDEDEYDLGWDVATGMYLQKNISYHICIWIHVYYIAKIILYHSLYGPYHVNIVRII